MGFHPSKRKRLMLLLAMGGLALQASAQPSGKPIIFTPPRTETVTPATPGPTPDISAPDTLPGTLQAPMELFDFNHPGERLPQPASPAISQQQRRMQQLLADRKNWTLMTPEEILGGAATEKMLQSPERDALGRGKNPTQIERYLDRQDQLRTGATNGWSNFRSGPAEDFGRDPDDTGPADARRSSLAAAAFGLGQSFTAQQNRDAAATQRPNSGWETFGQPLPQSVTKPDPEKVAAMDRFRQLLNSGSVEADPASQQRVFVPVPKVASDPLLTQPDFVPNPAGSSFTPLSSGISKPTGLTPLPGAVPTYLPPVTAPAWKPQPPPWLLQGPQPFVMPRPKGF